MQEFIKIAAHELRTPIQPILGLTQLIRASSKDVKQCELLDATIRNAKRLEQLTENILDVTRIEGHSLSLNKVQFNMNDVITNMISDMLTTTPTSIKLEYSHSQDIFVRADRERITQVINNLLNNAIKFTKKGTISTSLEKKKEQDGDKEYIVVSVKDTGQGMDSEILPNLFTKFASGSQGGTGLGLFISKNIIEAHGGKIWAENNKDGKGATFAFSLPLDKA
jgi:two-component system, OmpR family, sensor histidine kinase VicK